LLSACRTGRLAQALRVNPLPFSELLLAAPAPQPGEPYGRTCLFRDASGEILLLRWREGQFCAPHDHGHAAGFLQLVRGRFTERIWEMRDGELQERSRRRLSAPALVRIDPGDIHDMQATGDGVGVHFYVPPITGMKVFDRVRRESLVVSEDCGAWIPADPKLVQSRCAWAASRNA
jgi:hypothetical protein